MEPRNHASFHSISVSTREEVRQKRKETGNERERREADGEEVIVLDTQRDDGKMFT